MLLGTIFAIIGSAGVATFIMLYGLGINFNTQISLGNRRTPFLISYYIAWVAGFFVYFGILLLVSQGEHAVYASIWAGKMCIRDRNKTCNAYLKEVFRFYSFLEVVRNNGSCLSVLSYNQPITKANAIGVRRTIRSRSFKGYLKEEERNVRAAEPVSYTHLDVYKRQ